MGKGAIQIAHELANAAERARMAGDTVASLALAFQAAEYIEIAKLLSDSLDASRAAQREE